MVDGTALGDLVLKPRQSAQRAAQQLAKLAHRDDGDDSDSADEFRPEKRQHRSVSKGQHSDADGKASDEEGEDYEGGQDEEEEEEENQPPKSKEEDGAAGVSKRRRGKAKPKVTDAGVVYGLHLSASKSKALRKDHSHLLDGPLAVQLAALVEAKLASGEAGAVSVLSSEQGQPYRTVRPSETVSFLDPHASTLERDEDNEVEMVSAIPFEERLPSIGDAVDITVGPAKKERKVTLPKHSSMALSDMCDDDEAKMGCLLNVGAHVYSTDWSPKGQARVQADEEEFLCVSAALEAWPRTEITSKLPYGSQPGALQIWSVSTGNGAKSGSLEMIICIDGGRMACVRWAPLLRTFGAVDAWIGILAVARQDGSVDVYAVPHPDAVVATSNAEGEPLCVRLSALCQLDTKRGVPLSMEWYDVDKLAVGYSDGFLAVWSLARALKASTKALARPLTYARVSRTALSSVAWDSSGTHIYGAAYDGILLDTTVAMPDYSTQLARARDTATAVAYHSDMRAPLYERLEDTCVRLLDNAAPLSTAFNRLLNSRLVYLHYGRVLSLATSPHHPFVASAGADGTVRFANVALLMQQNRRWGGAGSSTLFRMDVPDRSTGQLRLLDHIVILPMTRYQPRSEGDVKNKGKGKVVRDHITMAWHPAVNVTDVRWNTNYDRETWLASGMAAGLVRIDVIGKRYDADGED